MTHDEICEAARDALANLIQKLEPGSMLTHFVALAEVVDSEGKCALWALTPPDAKAWDVLGLLDWARTKEHLGLRDQDTDEG